MMNKINPFVDWYWYWERPNKEIRIT